MSREESWAGVPVLDRPSAELYAALGQLKNLDPEGWCAMTDGSFDDEEDESIMMTLTDSINYLLKNK